MLNSSDAIGLYKRQLETGFSRLRFTPQLETAFISDHQRRHLRFTRVGLLLATAFYAAYLLINIRLGAEAAEWQGLSSAARLLIVCALLFVAWLIARIPENWRDPVIMLCYTGVGVGISTIEVFRTNQGHSQNFEGLVFASLHCCLFSGLLLRRCALTVLVMLGAYVGIGSAMELQSKTVAYQLFFLSLAAIMGLASLYLSEFAARDSFLRRKLMAAGANFDELTGLASRAAFDRYLGQYLRRIAGSNPQPQALVLADIDFFKQLNDSRGHDTGDKCLQLVAEILKRNIRGDAEAVARWGGDELIAVLPAPDPVRLEQLLNQIRGEVEQLRMENPDTASGYLSISIGALMLQPEQRLEENLLFRQTDAALYAAKQGGRNRVTIREAQWQDLNAPTAVATA